MKKRFKIPLAMVLILGLVYAAAPLWFSAIIRSQLPPRWQLIEAELDYPGWQSVRANRVQLEMALAGYRLRITAHGSRLFYSGPVIEITSLSIDVTASGLGTRATDFSLEDLKLPVLILPASLPKISVANLSVNLDTNLPVLQFWNLELGASDAVTQTMSAEFSVNTPDSISGQIQVSLSPERFEANIEVGGIAEDPMLEASLLQRQTGDRVSSEFNAEFHLDQGGWPEVIAAVFPDWLPGLPGLSGELKITAGFAAPEQLLNELWAYSGGVQFQLGDEEFGAEFDLYAELAGQYVSIVTQPSGVTIDYRGDTDRLAKLMAKLIPRYQPLGPGTVAGEQAAVVRIRPGSRLEFELIDSPALRFEGAAGIQFTTPALEIESLEIDDLQIRFASLKNPGIQSLTGRLRLTAVTRTPFSYQLDGATLQADGMKLISSGQLSIGNEFIRYNTTGPLSAEFYKLVLAIPSDDGTTSVRLAGFSVSGNLDYLPPDFDFSGQLSGQHADISMPGKSGGAPFVFNLAGFQLNTSLKDEKGTVTTAGEGDLVFVPGQQLPVKFSGNLETQRWVLELLPSEINAVQITPLMNAVNLPLPKILELQQGTISLSGKAILDPGLRANINIEGNSINFAAKNSEATGLNFKFTGGLQDVFFTSGRFTLQSINIAAGLVMENVSADIEVTGENSLAIESLSARLFGGALTVPVMHFTGGVLGDSLVRMSETDLAELLTFADIDGLAGSGALEILLPLSSDKQGLFIRDGTFNATGSGILSYTAADPATVSGNIGLQALADFHYQTLDGSINYSSDGEYRVLVHLVGNNPDLYDGYPIELNLNIGGVLPELFEVLFLTGDFEQAILERIRIK